MRHLRLQPRIVLATMGLVALVVGLTGGLFLFMLNRTLQEQMGEDALDVARTVARVPDIIAAMRTENPAAIIQPLTEKVRLATGADFIVVGNERGIRYSHPDPSKIGQPMVGGDNAPALLEKKEYLSVATGTLGPSMRGKVPILNESDQVIGVVSVGFLLTGVSRTVTTYTNTLALVLLAGLAVGVPGALLLARSIKRSIHGLEPEEIAAIAEQRTAILGAIREGIIAIDKEGTVVVANQSARELAPGLATGVKLIDILPNSRLPEVLLTDEPEFDQQMLIGDVTVVTNRVPVRINGRVAGGVASFRDQTELARLARELSDTRRYTEELRAQAHEFANSLQAISGMLQLGMVDEAVQFMQDETDDYRVLVEALPRSVADPALAALLLGKRARSEELHCEFVIDPTSHLHRPLPDSTLLVRIVGNLVDNALEAVQSLPLEERRVRVRLADSDAQVSIEVADTGPGIPPECSALVFAEGFSTKGSGRGIGLALVKRLVESANGQITVGQAPEGGALFRVVIPRAAEV